MRRQLLGLLGSCLLISTVTYAQSSATDHGTIAVRGVGTVTAFPNAAQITLSVYTNRPALRDAVSETQLVTRNVLRLLKHYVVDTADIKTSLISTDKAMVWNQVQKKEVPAGFNASQRIIFTLTDLKRMQSFTEEVLKLRIQEIERISYFNTNGIQLMKQAQESAMRDAIETTQRLAKAGSIKLGRIFYVTTDDSPATGADASVESEQFQSYGKSMQVRGISSSGQLITYHATVSLQTAIE